eukprot:2642620-Rhodomonas_salina.1
MLGPRPLDSLPFTVLFTFGAGARRATRIRVRPHPAPVGRTPRSSLVRTSRPDPGQGGASCARRAGDPSPSAPADNAAAAAVAAAAGSQSGSSPQPGSWPALPHRQQARRVPGPSKSR